MKRGLLALLLALAVGSACERGLRQFVDPPGPWVVPLASGADRDTLQLQFHGVPTAQVPLPEIYAHENRWLVLRSRSLFYLADSQNRQSVIRWRCKKLLEKAGFDRQGRLVAVDALLGHPCRAHWLNPESRTTGSHTIGAWPAGRPESSALKSMISQDLSTIVTMSASAEQPLTIRSLDTSGKLLFERTFPKRFGHLFPVYNRIATTAWALSRDGRRLAISDAWNGGQRVSIRGVDVFDTRTGEIAHNIPIPDSDDGMRRGAKQLKFSHDNRQLYYRVANRIQDSGNTWRMADATWFRRDLDAGTDHRATSSDDHELKNNLTWSRDSRYVMWRGETSYTTAESRFERLHSPTIAKVPEQRRKLQIIKRTVSGIDPPDLTRVRLIPEQTAIAGVIHETIDGKQQRIPFGRTILDQLELDQQATSYQGQSVLYYDWQTGQQLRLRTTKPDERIGDVTTQRGRVAVLVQSKTATTLEVYDIPPRSEAHWPTATAIGIGMLAFFIVIRRRKKRVRLGTVHTE